MVRKGLSCIVSLVSRFWFDSVLSTVISHPPVGYMFYRLSCSILFKIVFLPVISWGENMNMQAYDFRRVLLRDAWTMVSFSLAGVACPRMNAPARRPPAPVSAPTTAGRSAASVVAAAGPSNGTANGNGTASPPPPPQPEPYAAEAKHFAEVNFS